MGFPLGVGNMWIKPGSYSDGAIKSIALLGLLSGAAGCHSKTENRAVNTAVMSPGSPEKMAEDVRATIVTVCAKESFAIARQGLIVAETGLREDVFLLRDRGSYQPVAYGLDETQRLTGLLRAETSHTDEQAACIRQFAEHLQSLTEPLAEAATREREIDTSTFRQADKQAQDDLERESNAKIPH
jgi:hypothetical protein